MNRFRWFVVVVAILGSSCGTADAGDAALDEAAPQSTQDLTLFVRRLLPPALRAAPAFVFAG